MNNKRVLYIGTSFFKYHEYIIETFEELGYQVDYYNDRPSENSFIKGIIKIKKSFLDWYIKNYFNGIIKKTSQIKYDLVFMINCKVLTEAMMKDIKQCHKQATFILYMWDSFRLYPDSEKLLPYFDFKYSFDLEDCNRIESLNFLPLFYHKNYENAQNNDSCYYDLLSVCTAHMNRYRLLNQIVTALEKKNIKIYSYLYINILQYIYNKFFFREFGHARKKEFQFKPLNENQYISLLQNSYAVLDIPHNGQTGLTIRTMEALGAKKKLITTNKDILKYDFYNPNNIFLLDNDNIDEIVDFIKTDYEPLPESIYKKYSIKAWLQSMIEERHIKYLK